MVYTQSRTYTYPHIYIYSYRDIYTCICIHKYTHIYVHVHIYMYMYIYIYISIHRYIYMYIICVYMYTECAYVVYVDIYICVYTHTYTWKSWACLEELCSPILGSCKVPRQNTCLWSPRWKRMVQRNAPRRHRLPLDLPHPGPPLHHLLCDSSRCLHQWMFRGRCRCMLSWRRPRTCSQ